MASKKNEVRVQFLADTADFRKQVTQANSTITELSSELKLNAEQMRTMGETAELAAHDTDMVNGTRQILRDRGLSI